MQLLKKAVPGIAALAIMLAGAAFADSPTFSVEAGAEYETGVITDDSESCDLSSAEDEDALGGGAAGMKAALTGFTIKDGVLKRYTGNGGYVLIPDTVTVIGAGAFKDNSKVTKVYIPETVTEIQENAFKGCKSLAEFEMPASVLTIGERAFENCVALKKAEIGAGVVTIGERAFSGCTALKELILPESLADIGMCAFSGCSAVEELVIPSGVRSISARAFEDCTALKALELGSGIIDMGENVFARCNMLKTVTFDDGMTVIGNGAFSACEKLEEVVIPDSVTRIGSNAFEGCFSLKNADIGNGVTYIGSNAFSKCSALRELELPNSVETIGSSAFKYCSGIDELVIPPDVTEIGDGTFSGCSWLKSVTLPDGIEKIGINAFSDCPLLTEIELPSSLQTLGKYAFSGCIGLKRAELPDEVTEIGAYAFNGCKKITYISIPGTIKKIGEYAFVDCSELKDIDLDGTRALWNEMTKAAGGDLGVTRRTSVNCTDGTINPRKVTSIKVKTAPTIRLYYVKQTIILDGGVITVTYSNGDTEELDMTDEMVTGNVDMTEPGEHAVILEYQSCVTNFRIEVKEYPKLEMDNKSYDTFADVFKEIGTKTGTFTMTLNDDIELTKLTLPKNADIVIKGNRHTMKFVGVTTLSASAALTLENVRIESKTKNGADAAFSISSTNSDVTLNDLLFTGTELNVKGGTKNVLKIGASDPITAITGFSAVVLSDHVELVKTLTTTNLRLGENSELLIDKDAAVTVKGILRAEPGAVIELVKGFKPIVLSGTAEGGVGCISLVSAETLEDQQIFKTRTADLSIFDISGIIPDPEDGVYDYDYYVTSDKVFIKAYNIRLTVDDAEPITFAYWKDMISAITKYNNKYADYTVELLGNVDIGAALTLPAKTKYASLTIDGGANALVFTGTSLSITGDITFSDVILTPMKSDKYAATFKFTVSKGATLTLDGVSSFTPFTYKAATGGYIIGEVEIIYN